MPLPRVSPLLSTYRGLRYPTSPLGSFDVFRARYGDTYEVYSGPQRGWVIVTERADLIDHVLRARHRNYGKSVIVTEVLASYIGHGLLTLDGEGWRAQRRLIQPGFHRDRLATLTRVIDEEARAWADALPADGRPVDLYATTLPLALQIMARVLFSGRVSPAELHTIAHAVELGQEDFARELRQPLLRPWRRLTNSRAAADAATRRAVEVLLAQIADHRRAAAEGRPYDDLLQMLLDARYEDGSAMTDAQLVDETLVLILAGHETTAIGLACTLHLLAEHPAWAERLRAEWHDTFGEGDPDATGLRGLAAHSAVIHEGLRLYPPAYLVSRRARADDDSFAGLDVREGQTVICSVWGAHHNPANFRDPERFDPARYLERETTTNFAFGGGPRQCVGIHLALMEMQVALGRVLLARKLAPVPERPLRFSGSATLRPVGGVWVRVGRRFKVTQFNY